MIGKARGIRLTNKINNIGALAVVEDEYQKKCILKRFRDDFNDIEMIGCWVGRSKKMRGVGTAAGIRTDNPSYLIQLRSIWVVRRV